MKRSQSDVHISKSNTSSGGGSTINSLLASGRSYEDLFRELEGDGGGSTGSSLLSDTSYGGGGPTMGPLWGSSSPLVDTIKNESSSSLFLIPDIPVDNKKNLVELSPIPNITQSLSSPSAMLPPQTPEKAKRSLKSSFSSSFLFKNLDHHDSSSGGSNKNKKNNISPFMSSTSLIPTPPSSGPNSLNSSSDSVTGMPSTSVINNPTTNHKKSPLSMSTSSTKQSNSVSKSVTNFFRKSSSNNNLLDPELEHAHLISTNGNQGGSLGSNNSGGVNFISSGTASLKIKSSKDSKLSSDMSDNYIFGDADNRSVLTSSTSSSVVVSSLQNEVDSIGTANINSNNNSNNDDSDYSDDYSDYSDSDEIHNTSGGINTAPSKKENHQQQQQQQQSQNPPRNGKKQQLHLRTKKSHQRSASGSSVKTIREEISDQEKSPRIKESASDPKISLTAAQLEEAEEDLRKSLERRLQRRPTVAELKLDNILLTNDFEDVAQAQKQNELRRQKLFVGTRPAKKVLFYIPAFDKNIDTDLTLSSKDAMERPSSHLQQQMLQSESMLSEFGDESESVCMVLVSPCAGWKREVELDEDTKKNTWACTIDEIENEIKHYEESFCNDKHKNYLAYDPNEDIGPVVISIKREAERTPNYRKLKKKKGDKTANGNGNGSSNHLSTIQSTERKFKTIIRTQEGEDRFYLSSGKASSHELINTIKSFFLPLSHLNFKKISNYTETKKMLQYWENAQITKDYKCGLLYRKNGQTNENQFFSNTDESKEYKEFLEFVGKKVRLRGWTQFKGGLDVKNDSTGQYSIYTTKELAVDDKRFKAQIMFHVSTLLPYYPNDVQQLERKRHIGNDIVVLIFQDANCTPPFRPNMITSEFNHVFIVVQPVIQENQETKYSVSITYKDGVSPFGPSFSSSKIWKKDN
eukprot:gene4524-5639_t